MAYKVFYRKLGARVRHYRKEKELTIEKLAELVNLNVSFLGEMERGRKKPSLDTLVTIAKALNVDVYLLLKFD